MAKRKQPDTGFLAPYYYAAIAIGTILLTAVVYTPVMLFVALAIYYAKGGWKRPEQEVPEETVKTLGQLEGELTAKLRRIQDIENEGAEADLSVNVDGSFHRGSRLGKRLNAELEDLCPRVEELRDLTEDLRGAPLANLRRGLHLNAAYGALKYALATYALIFGYLYFFDTSASLKISPFVAEHVLVRLQGVESHAHGAAVIAGLASLLLLPILYLVERWTLSSKYAPLRQTYAAFAEATVDNRLAAEQDLVTEDHAAGEERQSDTRDPGEGAEAEAWHDVLGVSPRASVDQINAAYRAKMLKCHPDRVAGLDEEFIALAEECARELNQAREEGLATRMGAG